MTAAFVKGAHGGGILTTVKHYPGHGDTAADSHLQLATIGGDRERLDRVELRPFRDAIAAGVDAVMLGHIAVPALDPTGAPGHALRADQRGELRRELGFDGPGGDRRHGDAGRARGLDGRGGGAGGARGRRLHPPAAGSRGRHPGHRARGAPGPPARVAHRRVGVPHPGDQGAARPRSQAPGGRRRAGGGGPAGGRGAVARGGAPLDHRPSQRGRACFRCAPSSRSRSSTSCCPATRATTPSRASRRSELLARRIPAQTFVLGPEVSAETVARLVAAAPAFTHVLASAFVRVSGYKGTADMAESHARLLRELQAAGRPVVLVSFGSPYLLRQVPSVSAYICAYGGADSSQRAAIGARAGRVCCEREGSGLASRLLCLRRRAADPEERDDAARRRPGRGGLPPRRPGRGGPRGGGGGGRARVSRARCWRWARTACSPTFAPTAASPTTTTRRRSPPTRCTTSPASPRSSSPRRWR